jgi:hypothetical protein
VSEGIDAKSTTPADHGDVKSRLAGVRKRCDALRDRVPALAAPAWPRDLNAPEERSRDWGDDPVEAPVE